MTGFCTNSSDIFAMEFVCHSYIWRGKWLWTNYKPQWWKSILHRRNVYPRKLFCRYFSIYTCKSCRQSQSDSQTWPLPNSQLKFKETRLIIHLFCLDRQAPITVTTPHSQSHKNEWVCSKKISVVIEVWCNLKMRSQVCDWNWTFCWECSCPLWDKRLVS